MIVKRMAQGSGEWTRARLGVPTASQFSRIVTPGGKASASQRPYMAELLAEWALGEAAASDFQGTEWMERGKAIEADARDFFAFATGVGFEQVGLCLTDDGAAACSPDALTADGEPIELKCPMPKTHLMWLADDAVPREHWMQTQGQLWVTGAARGHFLSYCPGLPPVLHGTVPDPALQAALSKHVPEFVGTLRDRRAWLASMGVESVLETDG